MPELPEVETVRRTLSQLVTGKVIKEVLVFLPRIIWRPESPEEFCLLLQGQSIQTVERRGKYLRFILDDFVLVSHLRMEGRYGLFVSEEPVEKHTHVIFKFTDGTELRYKDVRQFGTMELWKKGEDLKNPPLSKLGPEPLDSSFTLAEFKKSLKKKTTKIKPLLLNQEFIAGLGNIYVDEALFKSKIHPETEAHSLSSQKAANLHQAIVTTLQNAVNLGGSSIKSYVNGQGEMGMFQLQLEAYGRNGEPCSHCGKPLEKKVVAGRGTHYCPRCQKQPKSK